MKIRNGFVSNSSSSSFILVYDKSKVLNTPEDIIDFIRRYPDKRVILRGTDLAEGEDIFELDNDQKKIIRCFPDRFIQLNTGTAPDTMGENPNRPKMRAYVNGFHLVKEDERLLYCDDIDVDMSDIDTPKKVSMQDINRWLELKNNSSLSEDEKKEYDNLDKLVKADNDYYNIQHERVEKRRQQLLTEERSKELQKLIREGVPVEDAIIEEVLIDNRTCEEDEYIFAERYLSACSFDMEDSYYIQGLREEDSYDKPYIVFYEDMISDKEEILKHIETSNTKDYIFWSNPVYNALQCPEQGVNIDFFELGEEEKAILRKKLLRNPREVYLLTNAYIENHDKGEIDRPSKFLIGYGNALIISKGHDVPDFEKNLEEQVDED